MSKRNLLSITEIEDRTKKLVENLNEDIFIDEFIGLFDIPKVSIRRARTNEGDFFIRNRIRYRKVNNNPLQAIDEISQEISHQKQKPRYVIVTDFKMLYAKDTSTNDSLVIPFENLPVSVDFFLAWNGIEKVDYHNENIADIKAAGRFTKLYDELIKINPELAKKEVDGKSFNLFLIRSLFLYFSEDTEIIPRGSFTNILKTRTEIDGSNLNTIIKRLFLTLDVPEDQRHDTPEWLKKFPYVNGELFKEQHRDLKFNTLTRNLLIEAGELLKWNEINPDILGAMIQTVANKEERQVSGMHYTSVSNIMKLIKPLFLDDLYDEYQRLSNRADDYLERKVTEKHRREQQRDIIRYFNILLDRISKIKFLDPACGSGNFLIIVYKELRRLEIQILVKIREVQYVLKEKSVYQGDLLKKSRIKLSQFSGIETDDFAQEVAKLSLYIAEHQMNVEMIEALADFQPKILPLQEAGNIIHANALCINWYDVVPYKENEEIYIIGNPPYIGSSQQNTSQKDDLVRLFDKVSSNYKRLDYISGWFYKGALFIRESKAKLAFVTTNSITQGNQIEMLWPLIWNLNVEIGFTHQSFKWSNSAKDNAGVTVAIIGLRSVTNEEKVIFFEDETVKYVENITPYLTEGRNIVISSSRNSISHLPKMRDGNNDRSYGGLLFNSEEYEHGLNEYPCLKRYFVKYIGGKEYINGINRYALFLDEKDYEIIKDIPLIQKRMKYVQENRLKAKDKTLNNLAKYPWKFRDTHPTTKQSLIIPYTSSEHRDYMPMGFVGKDTMPSAGARVIYDAPIWLLGILASRMHLTWLRAVGGRLKTDYRYSAGMVYNTFPIPKLSTYRKSTLEEAVLDMLDVREEEGGSLADLYGGANKLMNEKLREAHVIIDGIVERAYKQEPFKSDEERLSVMLGLYQKKVGESKK